MMPIELPVYRAIAQQLDRLARSAESYSPLAAEWASDAQDKIQTLSRDHLPSGSGFDSGCAIELEESRADKIVIRCDFHHMNQDGYYSGWTTHRAIVTPCLAHGFNLRITGKDRNGIKEYIGDTIHFHLSEGVTL